jgi:hypothetical protein
MSLSHQNASSITVCNIDGEHQIHKTFFSQKASTFKALLFPLIYISYLKLST